MKNYIDGFVFFVLWIYLDEYKKVVEKVVEIWKEYGVMVYFEFVGDDLILEGIRLFIVVVDVKEDEEVIFGWVVFFFKEVCDLVN